VFLSCKATFSKLSRKVFVRLKERTGNCNFNTYGFLHDNELSHIFKWILLIWERCYALKCLKFIVSLCRAKFPILFWPVCIRYRLKIQENSLFLLKALCSTLSCRTFSSGFFLFRHVALLSGLKNIFSFCRTTFSKLPKASLCHT
jgi:hypothetical protein